MAFRRSFSFKRSFFRWRLANFLFLLRFVVLCFIQHFHHFSFLSSFFLFQKTSVNAQPLSPSFFDEIAAHFILFLICVFAFALFLFCYIYVDFRVPLADPLGQIGFILDRFWYHCWFNFPTLSATRAELLQRSSKKLRKKLAENLQRTSNKLTRNAKILQRNSKKPAQLNL